MTQKNIDLRLVSLGLEEALAKRQRQAADRAKKIAEAQRRPMPSEPGGVEGVLIDRNGVVTAAVFGHAGPVPEGQIIIVGNQTPVGQDVRQDEPTLEERLAALGV